MSTLPGPDELIDEVSQKIEAASIDRVPFPHLIVEQLLPEAMYQAVLNAIDDASQFERVDYPGTGFGTRGKAYHDYGLAYVGLPEAQGVLGDLHAAFASNHVARALLKKFSTPLDDGVMTIPLEKHQFFAHGATDFTSVFDIQVDLPGYAIAPHPDVPSKIITFQLYLTKDDALADLGTMLCEPKDLRATRGRSPVVQSIGQVLNHLPHRWGINRRVEKSRIGLRFGVGANSSWFPWEWFRIAKVARAMPNNFLAFPPHGRSFHAVDLRIPLESPVQQRSVLRGFVRSGQSNKNWIERHHG